MSFTNFLMSYGSWRLVCISGSASLTLGAPGIGHSVHTHFYPYFYIGNIERNWNEIFKETFDVCVKPSCFVCKSKSKKWVWTEWPIPGAPRDKHQQTSA